MKTTELQEAQLDAIVGGMNEACKTELGQFINKGDINFGGSKPWRDGMVKSEIFNGTFDDEAIDAALKMAEEYGSITFYVDGTASKTYSYQELSDLVHA